MRDGHVSGRRRVRIKTEQKRPGDGVIKPVEQQTSCIRCTNGILTGFGRKATRDCVARKYLRHKSRVNINMHLNQFAFTESSMIHRCPPHRHLLVTSKLNYFLVLLV